MDKRQNDYGPWGVILLQNLTIVIFIVCFAEINMYFFFKKEGMLEISTSVYFIKYVVVPTGINLLTAAAGFWLIQSRRISEFWKNDIPLYCMIVFSFVISVVHTRFAISASIFGIPVLVSVVYGEERTTKRITCVSLLFVLLSLIAPPYDSKASQLESGINKMLGMGLVVGTYFISKAMLYYMDQKNEELEKSTAERRVLKENLKRDAMTGLFNHVEFYRYLEETMKQSLTEIYVAVMDIDDFKKVNDTYGHEIGNDVLIELSRLLQKECGKKSHISRYGGEEFAVIFTGLNQKDVVNILEKIRNKLTDSSLSEHHVRISISVGVAGYEPGMNAQELFERADEAMYLAKRRGKNQVRTWQQ